MPLQFVNAFLKVGMKIIGFLCTIRSGTNRIEGSAYYFVRNENTVGKDPVTKTKSTSFSDKQYGLRIGGPIIKNKLFFFANGELARRTAPTIFNAGKNGSAITIEEATTLTSFLKTISMNLKNF